MGGYKQWKWQRRKLWLSLGSMHVCRAAYSTSYITGSAPLATPQTNLSRWVQIKKNALRSKLQSHKFYFFGFVCTQHLTRAHDTPTRTQHTLNCAAKPAQMLFQLTATMILPRGQAPMTLCTRLDLLAVMLLCIHQSVRASGCSSLP